ncbi:hypothetical protein [Paraburkholderia adhaesiva]|uniref:hypothetical protein n=1 Tax=Paraburkholderia adhaesiva TaxID=2883244 RepID=UPI001F3D4787|nr:hypothetical protein [Paraburkholderia adhaesiva]
MRLQRIESDLRLRQMFGRRPPRQSDNLQVIRLEDLPGHVRHPRFVEDFEATGAANDPVFNASDDVLALETACQAAVADGVDLSADFMSQVNRKTSTAPQFPSHSAVQPTATPFAGRGHQDARSGVLLAFRRRVGPQMEMPPP